MSNIQQAASEAKRLVAMFSGLAIVAEHLDKLSSIEESIIAANSRLASVRAQVKEQEDRLADVDRAIDANRKKLNESKKQGSTIVQRAQDEAAEIVRKAKMEAREIEEFAKEQKEQAALAVEKAQQKVAEERATLDGIREEIAVETQRLSDAKAKLAELLKV